MEKYEPKYCVEDNWYYYYSHKDNKKFDEKFDAEFYDELSNFDFIKYSVIDSELSKLLELETYPEYVYVIRFETEKDKEKLFDFFNKKGYINNIENLELHTKYLLYFQHDEFEYKAHAYTYNLNMLREQIFSMLDDIAYLDGMITS